MSSFSSRKPTFTKYAHTYTHSAFVSLHSYVYVCVLYAGLSSLVMCFFFSFSSFFFFFAFSPFQCLRLELTRPIAPGAREFSALLKSAYYHQSAIQCCYPVSFFFLFLVPSGDASCRWRCLSASTAETRNCKV